MGSPRQQHLSDVVLCFLYTALKVHLLLLQLLNLFICRLLFLCQLVVNLFFGLENEHASYALVHACVVGQRGNLGMRQFGVFLQMAQLLYLQVGQLHLLLGVNHLSLELCEGLF